MQRKIRIGMVGGGEGAFIGGVHRIALRLDGHYELVAGCFSSNFDNSIATGRKEAVGLLHKAAKLQTKFDEESAITLSINSSSLASLSNPIIVIFSILFIAMNTLLNLFGILLLHLAL